MATMSDFTQRFSDISEMDQKLSHYNTTKSPGIAVMAIQEGQIVFQKGYGLQNIAQNEPITPTSNFRLGSVSKQFTAMAIALLEEQGTIRPDDKVVQYIPELPKYTTNITIRHLIHHLAGLPSYLDICRLNEDCGIHT